MQSLLPQSASAKTPWQTISTSARTHRSQTLSKIHPPLPTLPDPLPSNVTGIPAQILTASEISITQMKPEALLRAIADGELSAVLVTSAFLRRAGVAQGLTNCLTELLPERALARAAELDEYLAKHGRTIGPLHGLPISVKEHIGFKGLRLHASFISLWDNIADEDAHCLQIFEAAGAVFHARTTQPQTIMHLETSSNYFGTTVNPYARHLSAGGSSGGEGALISLRGSCLGIGSDIGGSIRSPAANCGIYGFKPTSGRLPVKGWLAGLAGTDQIPPVIGPLSTSLEGIKLFMQVLIDAQPWLKEPSLVPIPWKKELTEKSWSNGLRIGVIWDDGFVRPHPPIMRALHEITEKLKRVPGIEVVKREPHIDAVSHDIAWEIAASLYFADGGKEEADLVDASEEPWLPLSEHILRDNKFCKRLSIEELWQWQNKREVYRDQYARIWDKSQREEPGQGPIDVLLCPAGPSAAPVLGTAKYWPYTSQWNVLDYPAVVFPVTKCNVTADQKESKGQTDTRSRNHSDEFNWNTYEPETYDGVPVALQLVGRRYEDEKIIGILAYIKDILGLPFEQPLEELY